MTDFQLDGQLIRRLRENQGYSLRGFAKHVGISYTYLSQIERGERNGAPPTAKAIAEGLGLSVQEIRA